MTIPNELDPSTSAQGAASNAELAAWLKEQSQVAADNGRDEIAMTLYLAAQRLEAKAEISEAMVERSARAIKEVGFRLHWVDVHCLNDPTVGDYAEHYARAALEAALSHETKEG